MSDLISLPPAQKESEEQKRKSREMILALAQVTGDAGFTSLLIDLAGGLGLTADQRKFIAGPVIVHESPWRADLPDWMPAQARLERVEIVLGDRSGIVGPSEIAAVIFPRTWEAPMGHDLTELYLWASANACSRHFGKPIEHYWKALNHDPIADKQVVERGGRHWETYWPLAGEIVRKVIAHAPKLERRKPIDPPPPPSRPPPPVGTQLDFFDQAA